MTTRTRTVLAANVAPGMRVRRSNHLDWTTIPEAPSACRWPPRLDGLAAVPVPPGERLERHPDCAVADNTAPIGPAFAVQWGEYPHAADSPHAPTPHRLAPPTVPAPAAHYGARGVRE